MSIKSKLVLGIIILSLAFSTIYYRTIYQSKVTEYQDLQANYTALQVSYMFYKVKTMIVNRIDTEKTKELEHVKSENDDLRNQLHNGAVGVYINTAASDGMREPATACVDDVTSARLSDANQQDFLDLKERAVQSRIMIESLQQYITDVCLRKN